MMLIAGEEPTLSWSARSVVPGASCEISGKKSLTSLVWVWISAPSVEGT